jgi:hypothetical protein
MNPLFTFLGLVFGVASLIGAIRVLIRHGLPAVLVATGKSALRFLANKAVAIALLLALMWLFVHLPSGEKQALPFTELLYVAILIVGASVVFPLIRLLIFPEAAAFAESGQLKKCLESPFLRPLKEPEPGGKWESQPRECYIPKFNGFTPALVHYWFATAVSFLLTVACMASISH